MTRPTLKALANLPIFTLLLVAAVLVVSSAKGQGQRKAAAHAGADDESALFHDYRGVRLGMTSEEVRKLLGEPKDKGDEQDFFIFNETETAQIVYDKVHKVITISADFMTPNTSVVTAKQVFGADIQPKADGSVYKMVRYPKAGYWLSYNRTSGTSPLTTVTLQKIQ
ncbi:MAG: hypothetical protein M3R67_10645 [Acidobacteriota bacterium]|nr:hypothetical protein [Acidobacteriota bacterium]